MDYVYFCNYCRYAYTSDCKPHSKECCQEKARIMCELQKRQENEKSKTKEE